MGRACSLVLFLLLAMPATALEIRYRGSALPAGPFTLFAAPEEALLLTLPAGTEGTQLYLDGLGAGQREPQHWRLKVPQSPGLYEIQVNELSGGARRALSLRVGRPAADIEREWLDDYRIGPPPAVHPHPDYAHYYIPPSAFFEVGEADVAAPISQHFSLGQFLCKQQSDYPKYLVLDSALLIFLEGIVAELKRLGYPVKTLGVISAYRTPYYNKRIGNVPNSRHVYGDAFDFYVDMDRNGRMDDLNGNGMLDRADVDKLYDIVTALKKRPEFASLVGGVGRYYPNDRHGGFIHVDTRGFRARW